MFGSGGSSNRMLRTDKGIILTGKYSNSKCTHGIEVHRSVHNRLATGEQLYTGSGSGMTVEADIEADNTGTCSSLSLPPLLSLQK